MSSSNPISNIISINSSCGSGSSNSSLGSFGSNSISVYGCYGGGCNHGGTPSFFGPSGYPVQIGFVSYS